MLKTKSQAIVAKWVMVQSMSGRDIAYKHKTMPPSEQGKMGKGQD